MIDSKDSMPRRARNRKLKPTPISSVELFWMVFAPVAKGGGDCHVARVSSFVVADQSSIGAPGKKVGLLVIGKSADQLLFLSSGTNPIQEPGGPAADPFLHGIEVG